MMLALAMMAAIALAQDRVVGAFFDDVGSPVSRALTWSIIDPSGLRTPNQLPILVCYDDCTRARLVEASASSGVLSFQIDVIDIDRGQTVRQAILVGDCPEDNLEVCAQSARDQLREFSEGEANP